MRGGPASKATQGLRTMRTTQETVVCELERGGTGRRTGRRIQQKYAEELTSRDGGRGNVRLQGARITADIQPQ